MMNPDCRCAPLIAVEFEQTCTGADAGDERAGAGQASNALAGDGLHAVAAPIRQREQAGGRLHALPPQAPLLRVWQAELDRSEAKWRKKLDQDEAAACLLCCHTSHFRNHKDNHEDNEAHETKLPLRLASWFPVISRLPMPG
jgi:hypothetical protein